MVDVLVYISIFLFILFWLGQSLWVYLDARERQDRHSIIWGLLAIVCCPVGLIIYIIISREKGKVEKMYCEKCGYRIISEWNYCPNCSEKNKGSEI